MQSLTMAARNRGIAGVQLETPFYPSLEAAGIRFWRSQLALVVGPGSAGKSLFIQNLVAKWKRPTLAFLLDQDKATAAARFAATELDEPFLELKSDLDGERVTDVLSTMSDVQVDFGATSLDDIQHTLAAYIERFGEAPEILVIDNLGNMASANEDEWGTLKALSLELDELAREHGMLVICAHHTTDKSETTEPLPRSAVLGKISQYPRLILSVAWNSYDSVYKMAAVKNSSGPTDPLAQNPVSFTANPGNMQVTDLGGVQVGSRAAEAMAQLRVRTNGNVIPLSPGR